MDRQALVDSARALLGVPFRHEGRSPTGVDCYGLLIVVGRANGLDVPIETGYGLRPSGRHMRDQLRAYCDPIGLAEAQPGDILHLKWGREPQHLAIVSDVDPLRILHADGIIGRVVEHGLTGDWRESVRGAYRIKADG